MKVLLIDIDSKMANPAVMKISAFHKEQGDTVFFNQSCAPDEVYISCIFRKNKGFALSLKRWWESMGCKVYIGGSGVDLSSKLPDEIEHIMPDYDLYGTNYSIGFTSRGCIRKCPWCIVWQKEGSIKDWAPLAEFLHRRHDKVVLWDGNFLASPKWEDNLLEIIARRLKVDFNQGLDIRLVDEHNAKLLSKCRYVDWDTEKRKLRFSFDLPQIENDVLKGIEMLENSGIRRSHLMFYILVGYNTSYEEDMHRINLIIKEGANPYIMPYNDRHDSYYPHLERWINGLWYEFIPWKAYDHGNSQEIIRQLEG